MLQELEILNGELSMNFDPLNTKYTIMVNNEQNTLEMKYKLKEDTNITITGNILNEAKNEIVLTVYNDTESMSYYLTVYKEETTTANSNIDLKEEIVLIEKESLPNYVAPLIASICFLIILLLFTLLFKKRKKADINKSVKKQLKI